MQLVLGDCLEKMKGVPDGSIDMVLADPPYGTTSCKWDSIIPLEPMWEQLKRVTQSKGVIIMTASQPFTSKLIMSNVEMFKYCWTWDKANRVSGHLNAKRQPLRVTEDICVFYSSQPKYNPQMVDGEPYTAVSRGRKTENYGTQADGVLTICDGKRYPKNLLRIPADERGSVGRIHPTQKPVALMEYLVKTYTLEGETVLDFTMGSGTTGVACVKTGRNFIGIEKDERYFAIAEERIKSVPVGLFNKEVCELNVSTS